MREIESYKEATTKNWRILKDSLIGLVENHLKDSKWVLEKIEYPNLNDDKEAKFANLNTDFYFANDNNRIVFSLSESDYNKWSDPNGKLVSEIDNLIVSKNDQL